MEEVAAVVTQPGTDSRGKDHIECCGHQQTHEKVEVNTLHDGWREATFTANTIGQWSIISNRLGMVSRLGQAAQVPRTCHTNFLETRRGADICLIETSALIIPLTVPWEDYMEEAIWHKQLKYQELMEE